MKHRETHPTPVEGCAPCRWSTIGVSAFATPTRRPEVCSAEVADLKLARDMGAYKRLVKDGHQPQQVRGTYAVEKFAVTENDLSI